VLVVVLCLVVPLFIVGLFVFVLREYGIELFGLDWPSHDLNRSNDNRSIKLQLNGSTAEPTPSKSSKSS
jgi:hypothetical protein